MAVSREEALSFRCPRWAELPRVPLYMDQVMLVLEEALAVFADEGEHLVSAAMINNYVKQKLIAPPVKKKYGREQLASLMVICILKRALSINEAAGVLAMAAGQMDIAAAYDLFCEELEGGLALVFEGSAAELRFERGAGASSAMRAAVGALMGKLAVEACLIFPK